MMIDSTVLIDLANGKSEAGDFLLKSDGLITSRVNVMELIYGSRSASELAGFLKQLGALRMEVMEISGDISELAGVILERYVLRYRLGIVDAFVAATALVKRSKLVTHNTKHFKFIKGLDLIVPY